MKINFNETVGGSLLEGFYPKGWDMEKIDECCSHSPKDIAERQDFWNPDFDIAACKSVEEFNVKLGHEIALEIRESKEKGQTLALILPVGPMGMYEWIVYYLKRWNVSCDHLYCFNMDEWADKEGNTLDSTDPGSFQYAMEHAFYNPLGELTVPESHRNFATRENLPAYPEKIKCLKEQ